MIIKRLTEDYIEQYLECVGDLNNPSVRQSRVKNAIDILKSRPDNIITFDKTSSVYLTGTNHADNQPVHLQLKDPGLPINYTLEKFDEPAQRYCPAGVYEVQKENDVNKFVINSQNCIHCKTCDIKEPSQNITWVTPEGGGGPKYGNM